METSISGPNVAVLLAKATNDGWVPLSLVILMLIKLFCIHKTTDEGWVP